MMIKILFLSLIFWSLPVHAETPVPTGNIVVTVTNCDSGVGQILIALHSSSKTYLKKVLPFQRAVVANTSDKNQYTFQNIPYGQYGITTFQDNNKNMDLDLGFLFIPKEKYGFSNNARSRFGPPSYKKIEFAFHEPSLAMEIKIDKP